MFERTFRPLSLLAIFLTACSGNATDGQARRSGKPPLNEVTVLLDAGYAGSWPAGLDPATSPTGRANLSIMNAIFGGLFQLTANADGSNPRIVGVLASGFEITNGGKTLIVRLRDGVLFSDGTPLDAEAVRYNIERNLATPCSCAPTAWPWADKNRTVISDEHTIALNFSRPFGAVINAFPVSNINWIASPTALERMGEDQFKLAPVGAGPFRVVGDQLSAVLTLERNPKYWQEGRPYLDKLVFRSIGSEQAGVQALLSGDAQLYEGMTSTSLMDLAASRNDIVVTQQPPTSTYVIQLNTLRPPFDDERARSALYYATDVDAIVHGIFSDRYPRSQSFTAPGGLFHEGSVPGYREFDLERARAIVQELGGIKVTLNTIRTFDGERIATALQSQWKEAGIEVTTQAHELGNVIQTFRGGTWQAFLQTAGSYDPEAGPGVSFRFRSDGIYTGVHDEKLDAILVEAAASHDDQMRFQLYQSAGKLISDKAYAPFLFAANRAQVATRDLSGPGLTTKIPPIMVNTAILWTDVKRNLE